MVNRLNGHFNDYFNFGGELYNNKHYAEAYDAFTIYGDMPTQEWAAKNVKETADTVRQLAYHYAGISAFSANDFQKAIDAFAKARKAGINDSQNYVYEIACWQNLALKDSTQEKPALAAIYEVASEGFDKFGMSQPLFINNIINTKIQEGNNQEAIGIISGQIAKTPDIPSLYGLRAYIYDRMNNTEKSVEDYRKGASFENADAETLRNAARKIYNAGTEIWNELETKTPEAVDNVKVNYFEAAKSIAERAKALDPDNSDVEYILENIDYALTTYF